MLAYLHIPFCDSKCHYCAFNSYENKGTLKQNYMHHITTQLRFELEKFNAQKESITSLFIGGGTPSTIPASWYESFFKMITPYLSHDAEVTSEANPHSATQEWIAEMKTLGINRLSFGVQSFNEQKLTFLGRNHSPKIALQAIHNASKVGIQNISLDLIYGTALDTPSLLERDLHIASSLPINHLSAYALTLEEATPFYKRNDVTNDSEELAKTFVQAIIQAGFPQYEISNFGRYQSIHNKGYWEHQDYLGIGAGAVGFLKNRRFYPSKEIETYIQNPLFQEVETLRREDLHNETLFLGLRSNIGIVLDEFSPKERERVNLLIRENKLTCKDNRVFNNDYFLSDEIALFITQ
ncbi:coproporphyrinogen III oxidase family protein [Sulfurospirillum diekertiae]|uniref:Heme chaperone HemW n=1 Tax=Sulfurospirillum diekertiae TaxID=1854492 RepID=A0A6G9VPU8_9BACT|nr:radical SAM family heme chaperone HemW [Sulfurospirillum diekertiae]QIR74910.1 coproporphyrinogen III oxidase family protein [Sulfurospirillum diekertiae]QIR77576.1 coproporphyrinogen III oxidase family protein [Sulfurospirillum diekertiae]